MHPLFDCSLLYHTPPEGLHNYCLTSINSSFLVKHAWTKLKTPSEGHWGFKLSAHSNRTELLGSPKNSKG